MDPLTIGLISGGASLLGNIFSSQTSAQNTQAQIAAQQQMQMQTEMFNAAQTQQAEQFSAGQADIQRQYETQMSNSAYQRAAQDMKAAGLNPMLAGINQASASTPSVSSPSGQAASVGTPTVPMSQRGSALSNLGQSVGAAIQSAVAAKTYDKMTSEISNLQSENDLIKKTAELSSARSAAVGQEIRIKSPSELAAGQLAAFYRDHPELVRAGEVTKAGAGVVGSVTGAAGNVIGLGGRIGNAISDLGVGFSSTAKKLMGKLYTLPQARQKMKDLEESFRSGSSGSED
jgi:hypothetical protein